MNEKDAFSKLNSESSGITCKGFFADQTVVIEVVGILDTYNSDLFGKSTLEYIKGIVDPIKNLVFDMSNLNYVSSTGIGQVTHIFTVLHKRDIEMYLLGMSSKISEVFKLLGFYSLFKHIDDLSDVGSTIQQVFPKEINCSGCDKKLKLIKPGSFKCPSCQTAIRIDSEGNIQ